MSDNHPRRYRSLFWPLVLIGVGVVWLLVNLGVLSVNNLNLLLNLWPLLLVGIGLDLIFGRRSPVVGAVIGVLLVAAVVALLILAPTLNIAGPSLQTRQITEPLGNTETANVDLDLSSYSTNIYALSASSTNLFEAEIHYVGNLDYSAQGSNGAMNIHLSHSGAFDWWFFPNFSGINTQWKIGLSPKAQLNLNINAASGSSDIDLTGLNLAKLSIDAASGSTNLRLPTSAQSYTVDYQGASGSADISLPAETTLTLTLHGASGSLSVSLPATTAIQIQVNDSGSGSISVPGSLTRISGSGKTGTWQSANYATAETKVTIIVQDAGSGSISFN